MSQRAPLLTQPGRTMLWPVFESSLLHNWRAAARRLRLAGVARLSLALLLSAAPVGAQQADDAGWFDEPEQAQLPDPYYADTNGSAEAAPAEVADTDPSALTTFRPALDPYGAWISTPNYGTVWVPNASVVGRDFAPYVSNGHWALTADDDWIWVSDYPFGWAVFHYGRWVWVSGTGWAWVPGRTYANAWVVWRVPTASYAYVGWAPMPPSFVWVNGSAISLWYSPPVPYVFCPSSYLFHRHVHHHIVHDRHLVHRIARHTHVYPTPYRAPARPSVHTAAAPGTRAAAPRPTSAPRGPRLSAARIPANAVPAVRTAPPANAARLAGSGRLTAAAQLPRERLPAAGVPTRSRAAERLPAEARRPVSSEPVRRSEPSASAPASRSVPKASAPAPRARSTAPERLRAEPRSVAPARLRSAPSPSRNLAPAAPRLRGVRRP